MIVDAHHHFWHPERAPQPWMTAAHEEIAGIFEPSDLEALLVANDIDGTILVQGAALDTDTDYLFRHAAAHDWILAVTAWVALDAPERARERLDELSTQPKFRAIRPLIHQEQDPHWLLRPSVLESLAGVAERGIVLELPVVFPDHFDDVVELAASLPELTIVVDHLGKPPIGTDDMPEWEAKLRTVAQHGNVAAKISGLNTMIPMPAWGARDLLPPVEVALDCFGADRLLCGSDWPVCLLNGDYSTVWLETIRAVELVATSGLDRILGGTAASLYRLDLVLDGRSH